MNTLNLFGMHILLVIQKLYKYWFGPFETREKMEKKTFRSLAVNFAIIFQIRPWLSGRKLSMKIQVLYIFYTDTVIGHFLKDFCCSPKFEKLKRM